MATRKLDLHEGPEAWERFRKTMEAIISLPKDALPSKQPADEPREQASSAPK